MFYQDHEKLIYSPQSKNYVDRKYDPLDIERKLTQASENTFDKIYNTWITANQDIGDISNKNRNVVEGTFAEESLVKIARKVFSLPDFPECLDAEVLEILTDYVEWMEGKGQRAMNTSA